MDCCWSDNSNASLFVAQGQAITSGRTGWVFQRHPRHRSCTSASGVNPADT